MIDQDKLEELCGLTEDAQGSLWCIDSMAGDCDCDDPVDALESLICEAQFALGAIEDLIAYAEELKDEVEDDE